MAPPIKKPRAELWGLYWADEKNVLRPVFSNGSKFSKQNPRGLWPQRITRPTATDNEPVRRKAQKEIKERCFWVVTRPRMTKPKVVAPDLSWNPQKKK
jgi:hypothetical protein